MRNFFGDVLCECQSIDLLRLALTTPDESMEVTELFVICADCAATFYEPNDELVPERL
ncbi:MAG: hypothetical protein M3Y55_09450 [Pseudomonadota bacterium]|nr:hypothetical protein [Pseudomonadota bacterium]